MMRKRLRARGTRRPRNWPRSSVTLRDRVTASPPEAEEGEEAPPSPALVQVDRAGTLTKTREVPLVELIPSIMTTTMKATLSFSVPTISWKLLLLRDRP